MEVSKTFKYGDLTIYIHTKNEISEFLSEGNPLFTAHPSFHFVSNYTESGYNHFGHQNHGYADVIILCTYPDSEFERGLSIIIILLCSLSKENASIDREDLERIKELAPKVVLDYIKDKNLISKKGQLLKPPPITPFNIE